MGTLVSPDNLLLGTSIAAFVTGFMLGVYSIRGYLLVSPELADERRRNLSDPIESDESDVDIDDDAAVPALDHAPNWSNGLEADRRDGLRMRDPSKKGRKNKSAGLALLSGGGGGGGGDTLVDTSAAAAGAANLDEECKLVLVVRTDLGMTKGKIAAQCSHATLACYKTLSRASTSPSSPASAQILRRWERHGQAKIAVQTKSEAELLDLMGVARSLGVTAEVVQDAGRTQIDPGSLTVLGVGPAPKSLVDRVTGRLKLL